MIKYTFIEFLISLMIAITECFNDELTQYKPLESFVELKGGEFFMGINDRNGVNYENPHRKAIVEPFNIMLYPVTIASFRRYMNDKYKYKTTAEINGYSFVFDKLVDKNGVRLDIKHNGTMFNEMVSVREARWNRPEGGSSSTKDRLNYPVVHVSYNDAFAYCTWKDMRLPTEIEWEFAARGGLKEKLYPWGDSWEIGRTNLWQGEFPKTNQKRDGYYGLAPVDAFQSQNKYEMYDMLGNTWEWTSTIFRNPFDQNDPGNRRTLKGGSFIDSRDGENNLNNVKIRISGRIGMIPQTTSQNIGFRCAKTIENTKEFKEKNTSSFKVVRLRPPMHHHSNKTHTHKTTSKIYQRVEL